MSIDTYDAVVGRLLDDPVLETSRDAGSRFVVRVLLEARIPTGETPGASAVLRQTLVATGATAARAYEQFADGDHFIAVGAARLALCDGASNCVTGLIFEAWHLGHDLTRSRYAVDRTQRRGSRNGAMPIRRREAIERELEIATGLFAQPEHAR